MQKRIRNRSKETGKIAGTAGNKQEGQQRHHYRLIPDGFSSVADIEGNESVTPSHRFFQGRKTWCIKIILIMKTSPKHTKG